MKPISLKIGEGHFGVFLHHKNAVEGNYMYYQLNHSRKPFISKENKECQNQDLWRLECLFDYQSIDVGVFKKYLNYEIVNPGEWECAIKILNTFDFHGGYHGSERLTDFTVKADGKILDENILMEICADEVSFYQKSDIYRQLTEDCIIAEHEKWYDFSMNGLNICQKIKWLSSEVIDYAYLTMLPIKRHSDNGEIITDTVRLNEEKKTYDVSRIGHSEVSQDIKNIHTAEIWSDTSGIYAKVSVLKGQLETNDFSVQNTATYNKLYFSFAGSGGKHKTEVGEIWNTESHYDIYRFIEYK